jgi:monofunctional biosynthetic peptidoglycan transglycosylase
MRCRKKTFKKALKIIVLCHLAYVLVIAILCVIFLFIDPPFTSLMAYRTVFSGMPPRKHISVSIDYLPRKYKNLLVYTEDPTFYSHYGIDLPSIFSAYRTNLKYGRKLYGGSTISQQLARTLFLFPEKLYIRKYLELWTALTMELVLPKQRILELYLNYAEWGRGIYGIQSAAYYYYGTSVTKLGDDSIIRLLTLLPSPCRYTPFSFESRMVLRMRYEKLSELLNNIYTAQ